MSARISNYARRANTETPIYVGCPHLRITLLFHKYVLGSLLSAGHAGERFHFFNLSSFGREERMIKAEFRWLRKKQKIYLGKFYALYFCKVSLNTVSSNFTKRTHLQLSETKLLNIDIYRTKRIQ